MNSTNEIRLAFSTMTDCPVGKGWDQGKTGQEEEPEAAAVTLVRNTEGLDHPLVQIQANSRDRYLRGTVGSFVKIILITMKRNSNCLYIKEILLKIKAIKMAVKVEEYLAYAFTLGIFVARQGESALSRNVHSNLSAPSLDV